MLKEESSVGSSMASSSPSDGRAPSGTAAGKAYFTVDADVFHGAIKGRKKGQHWSKALGKSDVVKGIRDYARKNKNPAILLNKAGTQEFLSIQGWV